MPVMHRWYQRIRDLVPKVALAPGMPKNIVEKAMTRAGKVRPGYVQFWDPQELNRGGSGPVTRRVQMPVPITHSWPNEPWTDTALRAFFPDDVVTLFEKPVGAASSIASPQINYDVYDFAGYSTNTRPPVGSCIHMGDYAVLSRDPNTGSAYPKKKDLWYLPSYQLSQYSGQNPRYYERYGSPFVTGSRDPFPWGPEAPLYFQADLTQCHSFDFFVSFNTNFYQSSGSGFAHPDWGWQTPYAEQPPLAQYSTQPSEWQKVDKILIKLKVSLDGGQTWEPPYYRIGEPDPQEVDTGTRGNVPLQYFIQDYTHPPYINEHAQWGTIWLNRYNLSKDSRANYGPAYTSTYQGTYTNLSNYDPNKAIPYGVPMTSGYKTLPGYPATQSSQFGSSLTRYPRLDLFDHDDVLFKIVLEAPDNAYVQFTSCGMTYHGGSS